MAGAILWRPPCSFCLVGAALYTCGVACLCESHCQAASSGDDVQLAWEASDIVRVSFCMAGAVFGADLLCVWNGLEWHFAWQTQYPGLYTLHVTVHALYTLHLPLPSLHFTHLYTLHFKPYTSALHWTLHTLHSTLYTLHFILHTLRFTLHTLHLTLHTLHFTVDTPHLTVHTLHFKLGTPHTTLYT